MTEQAQHAEQWGIYNRLRELRRAKGLSQKELAQELSLNHRSIGYFELQDFEPNLRLAWRIADYFRVELEDVFYRAEQPPAHGDALDAEDRSADTSGEEAGDRLRQRPQARDVLNALLDLGEASIDELERRSGLTASVVGHEVSVLKDLGLVEESVQPGPVFGRPHTTAFSLTDEGRHQIVEFHRNLL